MREGWCRFREAREGRGVRSGGSGGEGGLGKRAEAGHSDPGRGRRTGLPSAKVRGDRAGLWDPVSGRRTDWGSECQSEGRGLVWLVLRKLLDTRTGGISCLRSRLGIRLSCSSKTAEDPHGSVGAQGSIEVLCTTDPHFPRGPGAGS